LLVALWLCQCRNQATFPPFWEKLGLLPCVRKRCHCLVSRGSEADFWLGQARNPPFFVQTNQETRCWCLVTARNPPFFIHTLGCCSNLGRFSYSTQDCCGADTDTGSSNEKSKLITRLALFQPHIVILAKNEVAYQLFSFHSSSSLPAFSQL